MVAIGSDKENLSLFSTDVDYGSQDQKGCWNSVLKSIASKRTSQTKESSLICLGDRGVGKTAFFAKSEKLTTTKPASVMEYLVMDVNNDAKDASYAYQLGTAANMNPAETLSLPVWILDGDDKHANLLQFAFNSTPQKTIAVLFAALDMPNLVHSLRRWATVFTEQVEKKLGKEALKEGKLEQERLWKEYVDPAESQMSSSVVNSFIDDTNALPLDDGTLAENCGVHYIVAITKSDLASKMTDSQLAKILVPLRRYCLELGATLVLVSSRTMKNVQLLRKYIIHRSYGFPFTGIAQIIDKETTFVPAGWDREAKIEIYKESVPDYDNALEPTRISDVPCSKEPRIEAEDDEQFLIRLMNELEKKKNTPAKQPLASDEPADNSPLASFFSNLLKDTNKQSQGKSQGSPASTATSALSPAPPSSVTSSPAQNLDPAEHLKRILSVAKKNETDA